ncbi:MAG: ATP-dependent Clp protease ATP-binding subunit [Candidatus Spechtbacterales bacterium]
MKEKDILHNQRFSKYITERAKNSIKRSYKIAARYPSPDMETTPAHLLYALMRENGSIAQNILKAHGIKQEYVLKNIRDAVSKTKENEIKNISPSYKKTLKRAARHASEYGHPLIGTEHILFSLLSEPKELPPLGKVKIIRIKARLKELMASTLSIDSGMNSLVHENPAAYIDEETASFDEDVHEHNGHSDALSGVKTHTATQKPSALDTFCEDLTAKASDSKLDPLIGREKEIEQVIRVLSRKNKNNPLLVGDAGVGKTAIVHGLAQKIADGKTPERLLNKKIFSLNLSSLLAGTVYRGEFEERMRDLTEEASQSGAILFIDEIHTLVGAGAAQGSLDAANIIKPALVNGEFQCIGATTYEEYKRSIEKDAALERRFQKVTVLEQPPAEALRTLKNLKPIYEKFHNVKITDPLIKLCIELANAYMPNRSLPDKALDILDEAAAQMRSKAPATKKAKIILSLEKEYQDIQKQKESALNDENYEQAMQLKNKQKDIEKQIKNLKPLSEEKSKKLTSEIIYSVVSEMTSLPLAKITRDELHNLRNVQKKIKRHIVGQNEAVEKLVRAIYRNRAGIRNPNRPAGSFLFLGPSGVGKTELARVLSHVLTNSDPNTDPAPNSFIKIDMSEYSESHTISRLLGSPPGYVGYEESGTLTDAIRKNPHAVMLFDEIEKAHPQVFNVLLQILEEGALTDAQGRKASFKNAFIILTSNAGIEYFSTNNSLGFSGKNDQEKSREVLKALESYLRPEITNRIDKILVFKKLSGGELKNIAGMLLDRVKKQSKKSVNIEYASGVAEWIVEKANTEQKGARGLREAIEEYIEDPVAETLLKERPKKIKVVKNKNKLDFVCA